MANVDARLRVVGPEQPSAAAHLRALKDATIDVASSVRELTPYVAVSSQTVIENRLGRAEVFKLDWNESTIEPSPKVKKSIASHIAGGPGLNWYPTLGSKDLLTALEGYTGLSSDHLLATNGSDDGLHLICSTFLDPGDDVVVPVPTYNHFIVFAQSRGASIRTIEAESPFVCNMDGVREAIRPNTRLVYLVSPNNPTGVLYPSDEVARLCEAHPDTLFVLDEAYFEFAQQTGIGLVEEYPNLIVTRTFSKAFGLAGLRVGYLAAHPAIVQGLCRIYNPKSVNTLAQIGAIAALDDLEYLNAYLEEVKESKELLREFFEERNIEAQVTPANFVVIRTADVAGTIEQLEARGVFVRDRSGYPGLEGCIRMTVGTVEQTQKVLARLAEVF